tara:strand:- start:504 stop:785 length:282 start_codon:yes stop_codon:yes gene_type:complete
MSAKIVREKKGRCTNMDEIDEAVKEILEVCPKNISPPQLAVIIANIVSVYNFTHLWPMVVIKTSALLQEHEIVCEALEDADDFMEKFSKGKLH